MYSYNDHYLSVVQLKIITSIFILYTVDNLWKILNMSCNENDR